MPNKKRGRPAGATAQRVNKSAWIRSQPTTIPAKEVVVLAKKAGIELSLAQVYTARSTAKPRAERGRVGRPRTSSNGAAASGTSSSETAFRKLVFTVGVDRAEQYLSAIKRELGIR